MNVDIVVNIQYSKVVPVGPGKAITTTEQIQIKDTVDETVVQSYINTMTPIVSEPA